MGGKQYGWVEVAGDATTVAKPFHAGWALEHTLNLGFTPINV